jgi:hypothetical protein
MAAHLLPLPELAPDPEPDRSLRVNRNWCRFCGCTGGCLIPICKDSAGNYVLAFDDSATVRVQSCSWYVPGVCSNPTCVQLLIQESHEAARTVRMRKHG